MTETAPTAPEEATTTIAAEVTGTAAIAEEPKEVTEIQAQLSEIAGAKAAGETTLSETKVVSQELGFTFQNTSFCAKSGLEFLQDLESVPIESIENHVRNGDFERWFKDVLTDETLADSLKSIRESTSAGDDLKAKIVAVIASRYS